MALQIAFNILLEPQERLPHSIFQPILPQLLQLVSILFFQKYVLANMSAAIEQFTQPNVQRQNNMFGRTLSCLQTGVRNDKIQNGSINIQVQLNKYKRDSYFLHIFQSNTSVCLIISVFYRSCEPICKPEIVLKTLAADFQTNPTDIS